MKFIKLTHYKGHEVWVNPDQIGTVIANRNGEWGLSIGGKFITVKEGPREIEALTDAGEKE